jgi:hypothetical protein
VDVEVCVGYEGGASYWHQGGRERCREGLGWLDNMLGLGWGEYFYLKVPRPLHNFLLFHIIIYTLQRLRCNNFRQWHMHPHQLSRHIQTLSRQPTKHIITLQSHFIVHTL